MIIVIAGVKAQTMTVIKKDGSQTQFKTTEIDYIEFSEGQEAEETEDPEDQDNYDFSNGFHNGHRYTDLGLTDENGNKILWATCNIGADNPQDYGEYFAWGETQSKGTFSWRNYKHSDNIGNPTKYNNKDNKAILDTEDDAAYTNWGGAWRLPTMKEIQSLLNCNWDKVTLKGVDGYMITGSNGQAIFIPFAGHISSSGKRDEGSMCKLWINELSKTDNSKASLIYNANIEDYLRYLGLPIRPVCTQHQSSNQTNEELSIIGTWEGDYGSYTDTYTFSSNGTYYDVLSSGRRYEGKYTYNDGSLTLMEKTDDGYSSFTVSVKFVSSNQMVWSNYSDNPTLIVTFTKK